MLYICFIIILLVLLGLMMRQDCKKTNDVIDILVENSATIILSCSIIASTIYAQVISKAERNNLKSDIKEISEEIYNEKICDSIEKISFNVSHIYSDTEDMMPSRYYRSADFPNQEFNDFLEKKIIQSKKFVYYGASARFTCKRLYKLLKNQRAEIGNLEIKVYIINPVLNELFESSKEFFMAKEKSRNPGKIRSYEKIIQEEKIKALYCLYALSKIKDEFRKINIYLVNNIPLMDIEMTDDMIALGFFRTSSDYKKYPLTIIYENKKTYYESYEFYLEWEKEKAVVVEKENLTVDYILDLGRRSGFKDLTEKKLEDRCDREIFNESEKYI